MLKHLSNGQLAQLSGELWGIACYFNPVGYTYRLEQIKYFSECIRTQGLRLLVVELAFEDALFSLPANVADRIVRVRSNTVLWQKERLLNLALQELPRSCDKVVWLDIDILFENDLWVDETSRLLKEFIVVQPFDVAHWLLPGWTTRSPEWEESMPGTAYSRSLAPEQSHMQGHWGFAWAAHRTLLNTHGLYDRFILGGGDLVIASAMYGAYELPIAQKWFRDNCYPAQARDVFCWSRRFYNDVRGRVFYVEGPILHMWHGYRGHRQYRTRHLILKNAYFDPCRDIKIDSNQCWCWNSDKFELHKRVREYFWSRKEEG